MNASLFGITTYSYRHPAILRNIVKSWDLRMAQAPWYSKVLKVF